MSKILDAGFWMFACFGLSFVSGKMSVFLQRNEDIPAMVLEYSSIFWINVSFLFFLVAAVFLLKLIFLTLIEGLILRAQKRLL